MATAYSYTDANLNSASYRLSQHPTPLTVEARIKLLRKAIEARYEFAWMQSYREMEAELKALEGK